MKTQQDSKGRIVALVNLQAMCERISGMCHVYQIAKVTRSRVHVTYSNPDEYGNDRPVTAVFPCYPSIWGGEDIDNPAVVMDPLRIYGPDADWQMFTALELCPSLFRMYTDAGPVWESHADILTRQGKTQMENRRSNGTCPSCFLCDVKEGM